MHDRSKGEEEGGAYKKKLYKFSIHKAPTRFVPLISSVPTPQKFHNQMREISNEETLCKLMEEIGKNW